MLKRINPQRGEIGTVLTLVALGIMTVGILAGGKLVEFGTRYLPKAAPYTPLSSPLCKWDCSKWTVGSCGGSVACDAGEIKRCPSTQKIEYNTCTAEGCSSYNTNCVCSNYCECGAATNKYGIICPIPSKTLPPLQPTPTPTATIPPAATNTPTPTATVPPAATNTPTPTATVPPAATNTPTPTATVPPAATNTPAPTATPKPNCSDCDKPCFYPGDCCSGYCADMGMGVPRRCRNWNCPEDASCPDCPPQEPPPDGGGGIPIVTSTATCSDAGGICTSHPEYPYLWYWNCPGNMPRLDCSRPLCCSISSPMQPTATPTSPQAQTCSGAGGTCQSDGYKYIISCPTSAPRLDCGWLKCCFIPSPSPTIPSKVTPTPLVPTTTPAVSPQPAKLKFMVKLPEVGADVATISLQGVKVVLSDGKLDTPFKVDLVKQGDFFVNSQELSVNLFQPASHTLYIKTSTSLRRAFKNIRLTPGTTLDCSAATCPAGDTACTQQINQSCGDLASFADKPLILGDADGFNTSSDSYNIVDIADYQKYVAERTGAATSKTADFNLDGVVDTIDLGIIARNFNKKGE